MLRESGLKKFRGFQWMKLVWPGALFLAGLEASHVGCFHTLRILSKLHFKLQSAVRLRQGTLMVVFLVAVCISTNQKA